MSQFFEEYYTFYYAGVTLFLLVGILLIIKFFFFKKPLKPKESHINFKRLNDRFEKDLHKLEKLVSEKESISKSALKLLKKAKKKEKKEEDLQKKAKTETMLADVKEQLDSNLKSNEILEKHDPKVYVLTFVGDIMANATQHLREEISLLLEVATSSDEVVVRLTSPGGAVAQYGLASAQLARLKHAGLSLTVCVDVIAASGGYMMASVADQIIASPFAFIGSIGVVAGIPNFHKVFQKHDIDYHLFTAGKHKRTITTLGEVTEEGKEKFQKNLEDIHRAFKQHVANSRKDLDIEEVATGDYWLATDAKEKGLIDAIMTSDDYLCQKMKDFDVIEVKTTDSRHWLERMFQKNSSLLKKMSMYFNPRQEDWREESYLHYR
ncbi:MAG: protease SohB [SAR324 cluster bacterium]|nr:protease SohB [SAR324 cluster bacterium]